jgi:hypothetical protein
MLIAEPQPAQGKKKIGDVLMGRLPGMGPQPAGGAPNMRPLPAPAPRPGAPVMRPMPTRPGGTAPAPRPGAPSMRPLPRPAGGPAGFDPSRLNPAQRQDFEALKRNTGGNFANMGGAAGLARRYGAPAPGAPSRPPISMSRMPGGFVGPSMAQPEPMPAPAAGGDGIEGELLRRFNMQQERFY